MESPLFRASYLIPMFSAIGKDIHWWCESLEAQDAFNDISCNQIKEIFWTCWFGEGNKVGLFADQYLVATFLDPFTSPIPERCLPNWVQSFKNVLKRFHKNDPGSLVDTEQELYQLMADKGGYLSQICEDQCLRSRPVSKS